MVINNHIGVKEKNRVVQEAISHFFCAIDLAHNSNWALQV